MIDFGNINKNLQAAGNPIEGSLTAYDPDTNRSYRIYYHRPLATPEGNTDYTFFVPLDYLTAQLNPVEELMEDIAKLDIQPAVFDVALTKRDYLSGYTAYVEFRGGHEPHVESLSATADTPEDALRVLKLQLEERFGKCPHCGNYRRDDDRAG